MLFCYPNTNHPLKQLNVKVLLVFELFCHVCVVGVCCREFNISLPEKIEALRGSCVIINCRFEIKEQYDTDLTESITGVWFKDGTDVNSNLVFNSRDPTSNPFTGKITGNLHEKNCTTIFYNATSNHNGKYYFRIETDGNLKYTYTQTFSTINVIGEWLQWVSESFFSKQILFIKMLIKCFKSCYCHFTFSVPDSPPSPRVQLYVEQGQKEVLEGSSVSLLCSAETLCSSPPPTLTWSSTPRIPLSESSRLQQLISDLNFTATHREHGVTFTCTITYQLQDKNTTAQDNITVHVQCKWYALWCFLLLTLNYVLFIVRICFFPLQIRLKTHQCLWFPPARC